MAASPIIIYRNYTETDTTTNTYYRENQALPSIETLGWSRDDGYTFTGYNTMRDGSGTSYAVGEVSGVSVYAQWQLVSYIIRSKTLSDIADAIRVKTGKNVTITPIEMPVEILSIAPTLQDKIVTPTTSSQSVTADSGYDGLDTVTVNAIQTEEKVAVSNGDVTPTSGKFLSKVTVNVPSDINNQNKTVTPTKSQQSVTADNGYSGLGTVTVNAIPAAYITTSDADAVAANILLNKTAYVDGSKITGSMPNNGATGGTIAAQGGTYTIPAGYTTGGTVTANLTASSITNTALNVASFVEDSTTHDYGVRASITIPAGYYNTTTLTKDLSTVLPAPETAAVAGQMLSGYQAYTNEGVLLTGTMTNNAAWSATLNDSTTSTTIPAGYHNGTGTVSHTTVAVPNPTISVSSAGLITASGSWTKGYTTNASYSNTSQLSTQAAVTATPTESEQTIVAAGKYTTGAVKVGAISSTYVGSGIAQNDSDDLTVSGATVTAPAGYYSAAASKSVAAMTLPTAASSSATSGATNKATISRSTSTQYINIPTGYNGSTAYYTISATPNGSVTAPSSISGTAATLSTGSGTLTLTKTVSVTPNVTTAGYISSGTAGNSSVSLTANVTIDPTPTASGATVTVPAGYYSAQTTKSVASGTAGTPTAIKGTVSNNSITVTPSVTNTTGYITGGTVSGTAVSVAASELVSGTKSIVANGTGIDVTNYAAVDVNVPATVPTLQSKTVTPTRLQQTITPDSGYDYLSQVTVEAITYEEELNASGGYTAFINSTNTNSNSAN